MLWHLANVLDDIGQINVLAIEAVLGLMSNAPTPNPPLRPYKKKLVALRCGDQICFPSSAKIWTPPHPRRLTEIV